MTHKSVLKYSVDIPLTIDSLGNRFNCTLETLEEAIKRFDLLIKSKNAFVYTFIPETQAPSSLDIGMERITGYITDLIYIDNMLKVDVEVLDTPHGVYIKNYTEIGGFPHHSVHFKLSSKEVDIMYIVVDYSFPPLLHTKQ